MQHSWISRLFTRKLYSGRSLCGLASVIFLAIAAHGQNSLMLGGSYDTFQFQGQGGSIIAATFTDCQSKLCWLEGSAYGTGGLQYAGHYTLIAGSGPAFTLTSQGNGAYTVAQPTALWLLYQSSAGNLAGEVMLQLGQDSTTTGMISLTGTLANVSGSLAGQLGAGPALVTMQFYDGSGLASLLGNTQSITGSIASTSTVSEAPAGTASLSSISIAPASPAPSLDPYGGLADITLPVTATGYFQVRKIGTRWVFVDPDGHPYWMLGVFAVYLGTDTSAGASATLAKYGGSEATWGLQAVRRLQAWGFNSTAEYSSAYVVPVNHNGSYETTDPMPWVSIMRPSYYSLIDRNNYAPTPVKDLVNGLDAEYTNYRGDTLPDVFDPSFAVYVNQYLAAHTSAAEAQSPWLIGTAVDDLDNLWGFGPGPGLPTSRPSSNIGWIALCTDFQQTANTNLGLTYSDPEVYTKYALMNWLEAKYGTIAALNLAWGSNYTTFGDAGGYGAGSGLLDEDGRDSWVGNDDATLASASPAVQADLNAFLAVYAQKYFSIVSAALRQYRPHQLIFGPATLNAWGGISRQAILAAAGQYTDVIQASVASQAVYDLTLQYAGDHPLVAWTGMPANPDSDLSAYPNPNSPDIYASQAARGAAYAAQIAADFGWSGSSAAGALAGSQNVVGSKFWAWTDSWGEKTNWGLVTFLDNPYDGVSDTIAAGIDAWGFPTGGESANYGNFIGPATQANQSVVQELNTALGQ